MIMILMMIMTIWQFDINDHDCDCIPDHYYHHLLILMFLMKIITILLRCSEEGKSQDFLNTPQTYLPGTMSTALWRSSPNCLRIDMTMPVLLFLPLGWDQPNPPFNRAGPVGGRRNRRICSDKHPFFCADSPPWSRRLDFSCLPTTTIGRCSSFDCGRQAQGDWGL